MITGFFGRPGCGKTSVLAAVAHKAIQEGIPVFCTQPITGCYKIAFHDLGRYEMPNPCIILIDEVVLEADNRDHKNFPKHVKEYFVLHRHYGATIYWASQYFDGIDKKIRALTVDLFKLRVLRVESLPIIGFFMRTYMKDMLETLELPFFVQGKRFVPDVMYKQQEFSLVDGYFRPPGLMGLVVRLLSPVYRDKFFVISKEVQHRFDTVYQPLKLMPRKWEKWNV
ncbi:MAG: ATP-binding protein [Oscillospiraceae bacterium]|jgi:hypothetical protein|nr:ATP-binding protein [Oscillospiraceae bacterium]